YAMADKDANMDLYLMELSFVKLIKKPVCCNQKNAQKIRLYSKLF
ncbi:uncharacterized protein METZ01_LOCUS316204, partial [marine metagenome]